MTQTPVMVNTICKWRVRQEGQISTNPLLRPLLTHPNVRLLRLKDPPRVNRGQKQASKNTLDTPDWQQGKATFAGKRKLVFNRDWGKRASRQML